MNNRSFLFLSLTVVVFASAPSVLAQEEPTANVYTRPRVVNASQQTQPATHAPATTQTPASPQRTPAQMPSSPSAVQQGQSAPASQQGVAPTPTASLPAQETYIAPAVPLQPAHPISLAK